MIMSLVYNTMPLLLLFLTLFLTSSSHVSSRPLSPENPPDPPPPPPPSYSPFKPSIAVIVAILTTIFSITFLLLMYAKHCKGGGPFTRRNGSGFDPGGYYNHHPRSERKNSGIDPLVIESLPVFRFGALRGGQKEGLECAVCLNRFEPAEVLRLLPKCKHAFHVECVDTWLDAHSTCPLCRFRVDPEDVLLVDRLTPVEPEEDSQLGPESTHRVSGRHSSAFERGNNIRNETTSSSRRSCDGMMGKMSAVRKDGLLITAVDKDNMSISKISERKVEHRIIITTDPAGPHQRWSDVQPCDLFYLRTKMVMSNEGRRSSSSSKQVHGNHHRVRLQQINNNNSSIGNGEGDGRSVINGRSVSEITGLSRLAEGGVVVEGGSESRRRVEERERERQRHTGAVSRWMAWISQPRPAVQAQA